MNNSNALVLPLCSGKWLVGAKPVSGTRVEVNAQVWVAAGEKYHLIANSNVYILFSEPEELSLEDEEENAFNATLNQGDKESIFCKATKVRPEPTFLWTVGNR